MTDRIYLCITSYFARDCTSSRSYSHTSITFVTLYGLHKNLFLTRLSSVYASCFSNQAQTSHLFFFGTTAASLFKVDKADVLAGL